MARPWTLKRQRAIAQANTARALKVPTYPPACLASYVRNYIPSLQVGSYVVTYVETYVRTYVHRKIRAYVNAYAGTYTYPYTQVGSGARHRAGQHRTCPQGANLPTYLIPYLST